MEDVDYMSLPDDISQEKMNELVRREKLADKFLERFADKVDWGFVCWRQHLSEPFIEKHADRVDWREISKYQELSESFIDKYSDKLFGPSIYSTLQDDKHDYRSLGFVARKKDVEQGNLTNSPKCSIKDYFSKLFQNNTKNVEKRR